MSRAGAHLVVVEGEPLARLRADDLELDVAPGLSALGVGVRRGGREVVALHRGLAGYRARHTTGLPLLHPWANRLPGDDVDVVDTEVTLHLAGDPLVTRDPAGLPMHGTCTALDGWVIDLLEIDEGGDGVALEAVLAFDERPELLATFPFPHRLRVRWEVLGAGHPDGGAEPLVRCTTSVIPTAGEVPVSFGWHPYLRLPGVPRDEWRLRLPARRHLELDERNLPTGAGVDEPAEDEPLGDRTFDDAYRLGEDRTLSLSADGHHVTVALEEGYGWAQVYAPSTDDVVALEPMTAPVAALATGEHPWAEPGSAYSASFTLTAS